MVHYHPQLHMMETEQYQIQIYQVVFIIIILEQATPKNDVFLRIKQDEFWIRNYQLVEFGFRNLPVSVPTDLVK